MGLVGGSGHRGVAYRCRRHRSASEEASAPQSTVGLFEHMIDVIRPIWKWIVFGVVASGRHHRLDSARRHRWLVRTSIPRWSGLAALVIALPLYVCATASVPIAAALIAQGMPTGAALVFLMAGPATNIATIGAVKRAFGGRVLAVYLGHSRHRKRWASLMSTTPSFHSKRSVGMIPRARTAVVGLGIRSRFWRGLFVYFVFDDLRSAVDCVAPLPLGLQRSPSKSTASPATTASESSSARCEQHRWRHLGHGHPRSVPTRTS